ncbi:uncharacterized protein LOC108670523 [Hyalella azteca]|uniref:Uncharacterized protein LOC108670523 n=1 Tax=Hyalella azteca TaxID=294128 RepID=A0A8B7NIM0_HYAAZ|nr:uncharacterized protein LOC108670523 [Hyalella azteca]XP_047737614.1 uncharacterized protein LOC108670523 [Hyalella azteca]
MPRRNMIINIAGSDESDDNLVIALQEPDWPGLDDLMERMELMNRYLPEEHRIPPPVALNVEVRRPGLADRTAPPRNRRSRSLSALDSRDALNPVALKDVEDFLDRELRRMRRRKTYRRRRRSRPLRATRYRPRAQVQEIALRPNVGVRSKFIIGIVLAATVALSCIFFFKLSASIMEIFSP